MEIPIMGVIVFALCAGLLAIMSVIKTVRETTCSVCGGRLPVVLSVNKPESLPPGDWACPKCGTQFNPQGRARDSQGIQGKSSMQICRLTVHR